MTYFATFLFYAAIACALQLMHTITSATDIVATAAGVLFVHWIFSGIGRKP